MSRKNCDELLRTLNVIEEGFYKALEGISEDHLNHIFSEGKMTIGQMAFHTLAWPVYFFTEPKPWKPEKFTCRPVEYPVTHSEVIKNANEGFLKMKEYLKYANDEILEKDENGNKGKGYLIYRLIIHIMVHSNQIAFLRGLLEKDWKYGKFGSMATALINLPYSTSLDPMFDE